MWKTEYRCIECKRRLKYSQVMHSLGRCPLCGHKSARACTIVDTTEHAYRLKRVGLLKWVREYK